MVVGPGGQVATGDGAVGRWVICVWRPAVYIHVVSIWGARSCCVCPVVFIPKANSAQVVFAALIYFGEESTRKQAACAWGA